MEARKQKKDNMELNRSLVKEGSPVNLAFFTFQIR